MKFIKWVLKKLIAKERKRQIEVHRYTLEHDIRHLGYDPTHLLTEAQAHYEWGHPIPALALLEAHKVTMNAILSRQSEKK